MHADTIRYWVQSKKGGNEWKDIIWFYTRDRVAQFLLTFTAHEQRQARIVARRYRWTQDVWQEVQMLEDLTYLECLYDLAQAWGVWAGLSTTPRAAYLWYCAVSEQRVGYDRELQQMEARRDASGIPRNGG